MERIRTILQRRDPRRLRGVVLAEAALVMILLCMVTLGAIQYGWFFYCLHTATNAARQGARVAAVLNGTPADGTAALQNALFPLLQAAATTSEVTDTLDPSGRACVEGRVIIPKTSSAVRLLPISLLPVPDCRAIVIMAKEG